MLLAAILLLPLLTGLACAFVRASRWLEALNLAAFAGVAGLAAELASLVTAVYAVGFFRTDRENRKATSAQIRRYYILTPFFVFAMLLVALANNLGVMWVAIEATGLACALLIAFYNEKTSLEAAWKYIIIGSVGIALALFGTRIAE